MIEECPREADVLDAVSRGTWPDARTDDLAAHAAACAICRDVAEIAGAVRRDYEAARLEAQLPSAGLVWWRAQLRARQEGAAAADRPITIAQAAAGTAAAIVLFSLGGLLWPSLRESIAWIDRLSHSVELGQFWLPAALALGAGLIVAPVVLLFVLSDD